MEKQKKKRNKIFAASVIGLDPCPVSRQSKILLQFMHACVAGREGVGGNGNDYPNVNFSNRLLFLLRSFVYFSLFFIRRFFCFIPTFLFVYASQKHSSTQKKQQQNVESIRLLLGDAL